MADALSSHRGVGTGFDPAPTGSELVWDFIDGSLSLVVALASNDRTGTIAATADNATASLSGTATPPAFTGTIAATTANATASFSATATPPAFTGTVAVTAADATASLSGTATPPAFTGTIAATAGNATASADGSFALGVITGTIAATTADAVADLNNAAATTIGPAGVFRERAAATFREGVLVG